MTLAAAAATRDDRRLRRVLVSLCLTQVTSWGVLCYAFPVLSGLISADTGWPTWSVAAAFSTGLVASALLGIVVGRWLDRHGPRWLMTLGSVLAAAAVVGIATAPSIGLFVVGWVLAGTAMSAVLYPPAFAALTRWFGRRRVGALTILTLAGAWPAPSSPRSPPSSPASWAGAAPTWPWRPCWPWSRCPDISSG